MGSGAPEIGRLIAEEMHIDYVDREIIARVAELLSRRERDVIAKEMPPGSFLGRIVEAFERNPPGSSDFGGMMIGAYPPNWERPVEDARYLEGLQSIVKELAKSKSIVIRGRGSQFILKNYPNSFHILTVAPIELRIKRIKEEKNLDEATAKKEIENFDSSRREFIKRYFKTELENPVNYDIVINTEHFSLEAAASIVINALASKERSVIDSVGTG